MVVRLGSVFGFPVAYTPYTLQVNQLLGCGLPENAVRGGLQFPRSKHCGEKLGLNGQTGLGYTKGLLKECPMYQDFLRVKAELGMSRQYANSLTPMPVSFEPAFSKHRWYSPRNRSDTEFVAHSCSYHR